MKQLPHLIVLVAFFAVLAPTLTVADDVRGAPTSTVEELAKDTRKEGFQWHFIGRRLTFTATVLTGGATPRLRIDGMEKDEFDTATIHNTPPDINLKPDEKVRVTGMIVDQAYGVWQIWCYNARRIKDGSAK